MKLSFLIPLLLTANFANAGELTLSTASGNNSRLTIHKTASIPLYARISSLWLNVKFSDVGNVALFDWDTGEQLGSASNVSFKSFSISVQRDKAEKWLWDGGWPFANNLEFQLSGPPVSIAGGRPVVSLQMIWLNRIGGDANNDDVVNFQDFLILSWNYGESGGKTWEEGDFNGDGDVGFADFLILAETP